jgi:hypothetical protein
MATAMRRVWWLGPVGVLGACLLLLVLGQGKAAAQDGEPTLEQGRREMVVARETSRTPVTAPRLLYCLHWLMEPKRERRARP